jgi:Linalool dehydratase/isomerase
MSAVIHGEPAAAIPDSDGSLGPVTRARLRRTLFVYAMLLLFGAFPLILGAAPRWQVFGLGLWLPGGGFLGVGGWWLLGIPATLALFALAVFAWFGAGMVIAPILVWLGAAVIASLAATNSVWWPAFPLEGLLIALIAVQCVRLRRVRFAQGRKIRQMRNATLPEALELVQARAMPIPAPGSRELSFEELSAQRYILDRALQPIDQWKGFDCIEEFQTAARRYQIGSSAYALATAQCHYTPSFHGYLSQAQRLLIARYLQREVWSYWVYETAWGHLNFRNFDPAGKDNIMLTAFFGQVVCLYMSNTGDRRYAERGGLPFKLSAKTTFAHDAHSIAKSVIDNFQRSAFCLYPCEPNWIYPICNHNGMTSLVIYDRLFGTAYAESILDRWLHCLRTELSDPAGAVIGLRSTYTGLEFKFPTGEAGYALQAHTFLPQRAWRQWATARSDLQHVLKPGADGKLRVTLPGAGFDFGNYRSGYGAAYSGIASAAREFGDNELAEAAFASLDVDCGRTTEGGVLRYTGMSNLANVLHVQARTRRRNDWRNAITQGPAPSALRGPLLTEARYPDVLVAKAFSDGEDLQLVLYAGRDEGVHTIGLERLRPHARYLLQSEIGIERPLVADSQGRVSFEITLQGRTGIHVVPAS